MALALLAVVALVAGDSADKVEQEDNLSETVTDKSHLPSLPVNKPKHTALHKPRPGNAVRDPRLVARDEQARLTKSFREHKAHAIPKEIARGPERSLLSENAVDKKKQVKAKKKAKGGSKHRKHLYQMKQFRGNQVD